jgi:GTP 3',8-cyclase
MGCRRRHAMHPHHAISTPSAPAGALTYRGGRSIYLNLTNRCSCSCEFCLRGWTDGVYGAHLVLDHEPDAAEVARAVELEFLEGPADEVVFCGFGEPTMCLDVVLAITEWLRLRRIRARLNTNGHGELLNPESDVPAALAAAGLNAVTVSLNAADPQTYDRLCRPMFSKAHRAIIQFAEQCVQLGIETALTAIDQPGADLPGCEAIAAAMGASFRARGLATPRRQEHADKESKR